MVSTIFVDVILPLTLDIEKFAIVINMDTIFSSEVRWILVRM